MLCKQNKTYLEIEKYNAVMRKDHIVHFHLFLEMMMQSLPGPNNRFRWMKSIIHGNLDFQKTVY